MSAHVVGIDPGPTPGLASLVIHDRRVVGVSVLQCSAELLPDLFLAMLQRHEMRTIVQVEAFVVGAKSMRSAEAGAVTRDLVGRVIEVTTRFGRERYLHSVQHAQRSASQVKPWASDARLVAAGISSKCSGMPHARDAARHALFAAVKDGGLPDPLSHLTRRNS